MNGQDHLQDNLNNLKDKRWLEAYKAATKPSYGVVTDFPKKLNNSSKGKRKSKDWLSDLYLNLKPTLEGVLKQKLEGISTQMTNKQKLNEKILSNKDNTSNSKNRRFNVKTNLKDELINKITEKVFFNRYQEINPSINIGTSFGSEKNWGADLGINLGKNKGINLNIGRKF